MITITVARKPMTGTVAANVLKYGAGAINVDGCRVDNGGAPLSGGKGRLWSHYRDDTGEDRAPVVNTMGRWPPNLIFTHNSKCELKTQNPSKEDEDVVLVEEWSCYSNCPIEDLSRQSKITNDEGTAARFFPNFCNDEETYAWLLKLISPPSPHKYASLFDLSEVDFTPIEESSMTGILAIGPTPTEAQVGHLLRVLVPGGHLLLVAPVEYPFGHTGACMIEDVGFEIRDAILWAKQGGNLHYVVKPSRSEREVGCHSLLKNGWNDDADLERGNSHPTVKPVSVMEALLKDLPPNAIVVDPFLGSGTTGIACLETGHSFIGIEREEKYLSIADARIRHHNDDRPIGVERPQIESDLIRGEKEALKLTLEDLFGL